MANVFDFSNADSRREAMVYVTQQSTQLSSTAKAIKRAQAFGGLLLSALAFLFFYHIPTAETPTDTLNLPIWRDIFSFLYQSYQDRFWLFVLIASLAMVLLPVFLTGILRPSSPCGKHTDSTGISNHGDMDEVQQLQTILEQVDAYNKLADNCDSMMMFVPLLTAPICIIAAHLDGILEADGPLMILGSIATIILYCLWGLILWVLFLVMAAVEKLEAEHWTDALNAQLAIAQKLRQEKLAMQAFTTALLRGDYQAALAQADLDRESPEVKAGRTLAEYALHSGDAEWDEPKLCRVKEVLAAYDGNHAEIRSLCQQTVAQIDLELQTIQKVRAEKAAELAKKGMELYQDDFEKSAIQELGKAIAYGSVDAVPPYVEAKIRNESYRSRNNKQMLEQLKNAKKAGFSDLYLEKWGFSASFMEKWAGELEIRVQEALEQQERDKRTVVMGSEDYARIAARADAHLHRVYGSNALTSADHDDLDAIEKAMREDYGPDWSKDV